MGRPHVAIAVLGLGSCLALALVMKTALNMSSDKEIPQAVVEIREQFGRQLAGPPSYYVEDTLQGPFGYLLVKPLLNSGAERLALSLGQYLWRCCAEESGLVALVVTCDLGMGRLERFQVNHPRRSGRALRRLGRDDQPRLVVDRSVSPKRSTSQQSAPGKRP